MKYNRKTAVVSDPANEYPISMTELKAYLKIDDTNDDIILSGFIASATDMINKYCGRYFVNTTIAYHMDGFDGPEIDIPYAPIVSITSIKTYDTDNAETTFFSASYRLDAAGGRVYLNYGYTWPTELRSRDAVLITYICGYGSAGDVPDAIRQAILMHAGAMYECRGVCDLSEQCKAILSGYKTLDSYGFII